jgi:hypothetical protein
MPGLEGSRWASNYADKDDEAMKDDKANTDT